MKPKKYVCPRCKQRTGVNILYGMPEPEVWQMADRKEIALGGCCISPLDPERKCMSCDHEWRIKRRKAQPEWW